MRNQFGHLIAPQRYRSAWLITWLDIAHKTYFRVSFLTQISCMKRVFEFLDLVECHNISLSYLTQLDIMHETYPRVTKEI